MTIQLIQSKSDFLNLKNEWNSLLKYSASHVPFLRHEYLFNWWCTLGGGEWNEGELAILVQRNTEDTLTGLAPFFLVEGKIRFIGSVEISDYLDLISSPDNLSNFISEIFKFISTDRFPSWKKMVLENLPDSSPTIQPVRDTAEQAGYHIDQEILQPAPYLLLPNSWDQYLNDLDDRYRHEIERKNRKADGYFLPADWYIVNEARGLKDELNDFLKLMANNPEKEKFLTCTMIQQMISGAEIAFKEGWLQLAFLIVGDLKIAGYMNFDYDGKIWVYNSGINPMFENLSPGLVLLSKLIQWSIQEGRTEFDFMRGDESYKYQFGGIDKNVLRMTVSK